MNFLKKLFKPSSLFLLIIVSLLSFSIVHAASLLIDNSNKTARLYSDTANQVNFRPSYMDGSNPVYTIVEDTELTGYAWGNIISWVNLNSHNCDSDGNGATDDGNFSFCTPTYVSCSTDVGICSGGVPTSIGAVDVTFDTTDTLSDDDEITIYRTTTNAVGTVLSVTSPTVASVNITTIGSGSATGQVSESIADFRVSRSGGTLSGYAFSENGGWINFGPFTNSATQQVVINNDGEFNGFAWIQNYGWLEFSCPGASCVRAVVPTTSGGGGGGSQQINGVCDPATNGQTFSSAPSALCSSGTPSPATLSNPGPWTWDCLGQNGGFDNYPNNQQCTANYAPDAPPGDTCQDPEASNFGEEAACVYLNPPGGGGVCNPPQVYDTVTEECVTPGCTGPECLTPPGGGGVCTPPAVYDTATEQCIIASCTGPNCTITPGGGCTGPDCVIVPVPPCDPATDPNCSLIPPDEGCVGPDCNVIPICTGPDCTITPGGGCIGADCSYLPGDDGDDGDTGGGGEGPGGGGVFGDVLGSIFPPEVIDQISGTLNDPTVSAVTKVITTAGLILGAGAAIVAALFASPIVLGDIALIPLKLWTLLLSFLGIKKKSPPWGTVFDSITMQPLDPAYVVLKDAQGNEIATSITDIDGRYGFPVEPGTYKIFANKSDYQFPSAKLAGRESTSLYKDLYFGGDIIVKESGEIITKNIPMDRLNFNWNEFEKNQKNLMKFYKHRNKIIAEISSFFFGVGFTVATIALIFAPVGYNIAIFSLYVLLFILRNTNILKAKKTGSLLRADGTPLSFAIVRVYPAAIPDVEITHRVADKFGNFYALVPNGNYIIKVDQKIGDDSYQTVFTSPPMAISKGLIDQKFII